MPESKLWKLQRTSKHKYVASVKGTVVYSSNNKTEFMKLRDVYMQENKLGKKFR